MRTALIVNLAVLVAVAGIIACPLLPILHDPAKLKIFGALVLGAVIATVVRIVWDRCFPKADDDASRKAALLALRHADLQVRYARLLAAARASLAAAVDADEPDPLCYLDAELSKHGQCPPAGARPTQLLAEPQPRQYTAGGAR